MIKKKVNLVILMLAVLAIACKKNEDNPKSGTTKGAEVSLYSGKTWSWTETDNNGKPVKLGVTIDDAALNSLPAGTPPSEGDEAHNDLTLSLSSKTVAAPFNHVGLDWNPVGHPPEDIYTEPHFDFHFYMISEAEQMAIPAYEQDSAKFKNIPAADYVPANYMYFGGGVPMMGSHLIDVTSPELDPVHPQPFTQTFIYGSYDGKIIFYEPMITLAFLKSTTDFERTIPQPAKYQQTGYYPTSMKIKKHDGVTDIILDGFVLRQAS